jgi:OPT family oligopeptide transporter
MASENSVKHIVHVLYITALLALLNSPFVDHAMSADTIRQRTSRTSEASADIVSTEGVQLKETEEEYEEDSHVSVRSILLGWLTGSIIGAGNVYLGLKIGSTVGAGLFGAIVGFGCLRLMSKLPRHLMGGGTGPKENCALQTAATAAGGLATSFVSSIPVMFRQQLLEGTPSQYLVLFVLWSLCSGYYGIFFGIPFRKFCILKQKLVFPSPTAAAQTIKAFHKEKSSSGGQARVILYVMLAVIAFLTLAFFLPIIKDWHIFYWIGQYSESNAFRDIDSWNWYIDWSPVYLGSGMLTGYNANLSYLFGSAIVWGILGPVLLSTGQVKSKFSMGKQVIQGSPSAKFWLLWPSIVMMVVSSFLELGFVLPTVFRGLLSALRQGKDGAVNENEEEKEPLNDDLPDAPEDQQIPRLWWVLGLIISVTVTVLVLYFYFNMSPVLSLLAILVAFFLSFIGIQASGTTDTNPIGTIAKCSQIIFSGFKDGSVKQRMINNLMTGSIASNAASHTVDMVGDLKTGHLLGASPKAQFIAQALGTIPAIIISPLVYILFSKFFPCINDPEISCNGQFGLVAVNAWEGITIALTADVNPVPVSALWACLAAAIVSIICTSLRYKYKNTYACYIPNTTVIGFAFVSDVVPQPIMMTFGSLMQPWIATRFGGDMTAILASGLIAGEGIFGVLNALMVFAGAAKGSISTFGVPK